MLFDSDVVIWCLRGNPSAARVVAEADDRAIAIISYMEVLQGARDRRDAQESKAFLARRSFRTVPLTERIGQRAAIYVEEYSLGSGIDTVDALIAATAVEHGLVLCTGNAKHYRAIAELAVKAFRP